MTNSNASIAQRVLKDGLEQRDSSVILELVAPNYIQHSAAASDGREGFLDFVNNGPELGIQIHRVVEDGDLVAVHATYTFPGDKMMVAFDVFRVEDGRLAEHWDALQAAVPASESVSGRTMVDGPTDVTDLDATEANRKLVAEFTDVVLTQGKFDRITEFVSSKTYLQHNPGAGDGLDGLNTFVGSLAEAGLGFGYTRTPLVVAAGNFVLTASEGFFGPSGSKPFAVFYDLYQVDDGKIVEHWDVIPSPAPNPDELPHGNGLF